MRHDARCVVCLSVARLWEYELPRVDGGRIAGRGATIHVDGSASNVFRSERVGGTRYVFGEGKSKKRKGGE